jgi:hypothetical protein
MSAAFRKPNEIVTDALRAELVTLLPRLTEKQRAFFDKVFPGGIDAQPDDKLKTAISLCQRTIQKNEASL